MKSRQAAIRVLDEIIHKCDAAAADPFRKQEVKTEENEAPPAPEQDEQSEGMADSDLDLILGADSEG